MLDAEYGDPVFDALTVLHAWVFGGGSIDRTGFVPTFVVSDGDPDGLCRSALEQAGMTVRESRSQESGRARELAPRKDATVLGRFLNGVLGAPVGAKNERAGLALPTWLRQAPMATKLLWARTYVTLRATPIDSNMHGVAAQLAEQRSDAFRAAVGGLLQELAGEEDVTIGTAIFLRPEAVSLLDRVPSLRGTS